MADKNYKVELDVLASAGEEGLVRLASEGNTVYVDFEELERVSLDDRHRLKGAARDVLEYTNQHIGEGGGGTLPSKGKISGEEPPKGTIYITRSPARKSRLLRAGERVDFPDFLKYSVDALKSGLKKLDYTGEGEPTFEKVMEENGIEFDEAPNHQYVLLNGQRVYMVRRNLSSNKDNTRYADSGKTPQLVPVRRELDNLKPKVNGFKPKNLEQLLAFKGASDSNVEISFITGGSGSGKTIVAYAAALDLILGDEKNREKWKVKERIVLYKPNNLLGGKMRDIGFLPGNAFDKVYPIIRSFEDAHRLCGIDPKEMPFRQMLYHPKFSLDSGFQTRDKKHSKISLHSLPENSQAIGIEHLQWGRGRSFTNTVILVDEAQNYTPYEMKQLIERAGEGSKLLILGDPEQVDGSQNNLNPEFNGLLFAAKHLRKKHPRISFMHLDENFRSQAAEIMRRVKAPMGF